MHTTGIVEPTSPTDGHTHGQTGDKNITLPVLPNGGGGTNMSRLEKVAVDGSVECCAPPPRWCDLEL